MRLFVAIVPPRSVVEHLDGALTLLRGPAPEGRPSLRWVPASSWHVTVAFFGQVPEGAVPDLAQDLRGEVAGTGPFELRLRGAGVFDRRALWVGCAGDADGLAALSATCMRVGEHLTGRVDRRERSRAHLTVARVGTAGRRRSRTAAKGFGAKGSEVADLARALAVYEGPTWQAHEVVLLASWLGEGPGGGPRHEPLDRIQLGDVGAAGSGGTGPGGTGPGGTGPGGTGPSGTELSGTELGGTEPGGTSDRDGPPAGRGTGRQGSAP